MTNSLKKDRLDELIIKLGMRYELKPLLDSGATLENFEKAVKSCLNLYPENSFPNLYKFDKKTGRLKRYSKFDGYSKRFFIINYFKQFYGIDCEPLNINQIHKKAIEKYRTIETPSYLTPPELNSRDDKTDRYMISQRIKYVVNVLKTHKKDIWYGMIPNSED